MWRRHAPWVLPAALAAIAVYANTIAGAFVYDDLRQIARNPLIQDTTQFWRAVTSDVWAFKGGGLVAASNYWRPTFVLWLIGNYQAFGLHPAGWHVTNVVLHVLVTVLAYGVLRRLTIPALVSGAIALVFAVHPVHTESVAWISGSPDLLLSAALLGAMHVVLSFGDRPSTARWIAALSLYALALGAKEVAVVFPIFVGLLLWPRLAVALPFAGLAGVYLVSRLAVLGQFSRTAEAGVGLGPAILSAPEALMFYLRQAAFPWWIGPSYPLRPIGLGRLTVGNFFAPLLVSIAFVAVGALLARRSARARIGLGLFLLFLLPALNISAFIPEQMVHDRYLYLPLLGFLIVIAAACEPLERLVKSGSHFVPRVLAAALAVCAVPLAWQTWTYNRAWTNEILLWQRAVESDPTSSFNLAQHASVLFDAGRFDQTVAAADRSLALAENAIAHLNRARALVELHRFGEAERDLQTIVLTPDNQINLYTLYQGYEALAICYERQGLLDRAAASLADGRRRLPIYKAALTEKLAVVLYQGGRKADALLELEGARAAARVELLPESRAVFLRLAMLYAEAGRAAEARTAVLEFLSLTRHLRDAETVDGRAQAQALLGQLSR